MPVHCPDLKAQLRMMRPELQGYVRELQMKVQKRKNTSQGEDEDEAITDVLVGKTTTHVETILPNFVFYSSSSPCGVILFNVTIHDVT